MTAFTLLNTRPAHQAEQLNQQLAAAGGDSINCPLIDIQWLTIAPSFFVENPKFDLAIFTSVNAVLGWQQQTNPTTQFNKTYAIGKATQRQGSAIGLKITCPEGERFDSEQLLVQADFSQVAGQKIALIKGLNGRTLIAETLQKRGADVVEIDVYQRQPAEFCRESWLRFLQSETAVLLISSYENWQVLLESLSTAYPQYRNEQALIEAEFWQKICGMVVMSQRIADLIRQQGWAQPIAVVQTQTNAGIVEAAQKLR